MIEGGSRRVRFLFRTAGSVDRPFCWLELRGDDLYWGSSGGKRVEGAVATLEGNVMTLTVPDEIEMSGAEAVKTSFHASGQFHLKQGKELTDAPLHWRGKSEITAPYRIATLLSKHPVLYESYPPGRNLTRRQTYAQIISVPPQYEKTRYYFEFFLCPEGRFSFPPPVLSGASASSDVITCSLNKQLILVARPLIVASDSPLAHWHPELDVWVYGGDEWNDTTTDPRL